MATDDEEGRLGCLLALVLVAAFWSAVLAYLMR